MTAPHRRPAARRLALALGGGAATGAAAAAGARRILRHRPADAADRQGRRIHEGGRDRDVRWPLPWSSVQDRTRRAATTGPASTKGVGDRRPRRAQGAALPLRHARTGSPPSRRRCRSTTPGSAPAGRPSSPPRSNATGRGGEFWTEQHRTGAASPTFPGSYEPATPKPPIPSAADPHLADLERGQLLLLRAPGLAEPLREAADDLQPGDQSRRPGRQGDPHRPLRETDRAAYPQGMPAAQFLETALPRAGDQDALRRHRPAPLRGRHGNARRTTSRNSTK